MNRYKGYSPSEYIGISCKMCGWTCKLYTDLVVHQLKIHKLAIQNVTKVTEVIPFELIGIVPDLSDSDSQSDDNIPFEIEPSNETNTKEVIDPTCDADSLKDENDWFANDANSDQSSDSSENQCEAESDEPANQKHIPRCYKCDKTFSVLGTLRKHMVKIHGMLQEDAQEYINFQSEGKKPRIPRLYNNPVACRECNVTFVRPITLRAHYVRMHQMNAGEVNKLLPKGVRRKRSEIEATANNVLQSDGTRRISATECYSCKKRFGGVMSLFKHFYRVHEPAVSVKPKRRKSKLVGSTFACNICNRPYQIRHKLQSHLITVHGLTESVAWAQSEQAKSTTTLPNESEQLLFRCEICQSVHATRLMLRQHIIRGHALSTAEALNLMKDAEPTLCPRAQTVQQWVCYVCKKPLSKKSSLQIHLERFHPIKNSRSTIKIKKPVRPVPRECHICQKMFRFEYTLQNHLERSHHSKRSSTAQKNKSPRLYPCNHCEMVFKRAWKLDEHIKSLKKGKSLMCKKCYTGFDNRADLVQHMEQSEKCKKKPMAKTALCTYCGESFVSNWTLEVHTRRHLNIRPFECDKCDQKFYTRLQLRRHEPSHVTERQWFLCPVEGCGKSYNQLSCLKYHEKQKHSEPTLKCPHCDKMFTTERYRTYDNP